MAVSEGVRARAFAADAETERAWREGLAGREARVRRGRVAAALRSLAVEPASALVAVDLDGAADPASAIAEVVSVCAPGTAVVAVGSADTADLVRTLLEHGVADYILKPVSPAAVRSVCAAILDDAPQRPHAGHTIAVAGSAGSGASTLTAALALDIAAGGRAVSVVDLDPVSHKLSVRFGAEPAAGFAELLAAPDIAGDRLDGLGVAAAAGVSLFAYPETGPPPPPPAAEALRALMDALANRAHAVLVTGGATPEVRLGVMQHADTRILLFEPTLQSIGAAVRGLSLLGREFGALLVQNHPRMRAAALSRAQIRYALADRHPDVVVPFDPSVEATNAGTAAPFGGKAYRAALRRVMEQAVDGPAR